MTEPDVRIVDLDEYKPSDEEILSFFAMMGAEEQRQSDYEVNRSHDNDTPAQLVAWYHSDPAPDNHWLWAMDGHRCVGMIGLNQGKGHKAHCGELGIGLEPEFRRQGLGRRMMQAALAKARLLGLKRLEADCFADNAAAVGLLLACGFVEEGRRPKAILKDGKLSDHRLFGLVLPESFTDEVCTTA